MKTAFTAVVTSGIIAATAFATPAQAYSSRDRGVSSHVRTHSARTHVAPRRAERRRVRTVRRDTRSYDRRSRVGIASWFAARTARPARTVRTVRVVRTVRPVRTTTRRVSWFNFPRSTTTRTRWSWDRSWLNRRTVAAAPVRRPVRVASYRAVRAAPRTRFNWNCASWFGRRTTRVAPARVVRTAPRTRTVWTMDRRSLFGSRAERSPRASYRTTRVAERSTRTYARRR